MFSKCIFSFLLNVCSSFTKSQGCRSLPAYRGRKIHLGLERRQSGLPAAERHHCKQSPGGASAAARTGDVQVGQKHPPTEDGMRMSPQAVYSLQWGKTRTPPVFNSKCFVSEGSTGRLKGRWLMGLQNHSLRAFYSLKFLILLSTVTWSDLWEVSPKNPSCASVHL